MLTRMMGCIGLYRPVVDSSGPNWALLGFAGLLWTVLGRTGLYLAALDCTGLYWAALTGLYCEDDIICKTTA